MAKLISLVESPLLSIARRVDFVKIAERLGRLEPGRSFVEKRLTGPAFDDQKAIARLAVDLTERAISEQGAPVNRQEIMSHVDLISCRYDFELHQKAKAACRNVIGHLFESRSEDHLMTSEDLRELRHLAPLMKAQE